MFLQYVFNLHYSNFWLYIDELAGKGLDIITIGKFFIYFSPKLVPLVLPLSILLASLTTYGTLSENYEFIAMKSNGISIVRSMITLFIFHVFLGVDHFIFLIMLQLLVR
ncbi:MAG: hypothetical protein CM15mP102_20270 [Flavobacteriales bacterium]|nr:MAG: hypothetical protein CM15mP102_20270 [Flavobacteriales bacterium]